METNQQNQFSQESNMNIAHEVKKFYSGDFKALFMTFFNDPFDGIISIFRNPGEKAFINSMILYGSCFVLYFLGTYLLAGEMQEFLTFGSLLSIALVPVLIMLSVSVLSFFIKSLFGKADFRGELLTGALCGIPLGLIIPLSLLAKIFGNSSDVMMMLSNPMGGGMFMGLIMLYFVLMMINVFQQSLKSGGTKQVLAWYISPLSILLSIYIAFSLSRSLF